MSGRPLRGCLLPCCRASEGYPVYEDMQAGEYGSLGKCDLPVAALDRMAEAINELAPDALMWTGDVVPHDIWNQSLEHSIKYGDFLTDYMNENFSKWQKYAIDGNHDFGQTLNSFDFTRVDPNLAHQAETWKSWFTPEAHAQFC